MPRAGWWCLVLAATAVAAAPFTPTDDQLAAVYPHAVRATHVCHDRCNATTCVDVFCYANANNRTLEIPVGARWNFFSPPPLDRGQPTRFLAETAGESSADVDAAPERACFAVHSPCGGGGGRGARRVKWTLRTNHPTERHVYLWLARTDGRLLLSVLTDGRFGAQTGAVVRRDGSVHVCVTIRGGGAAAAALESCTLPVPDAMRALSIVTHGVDTRLCALVPEMLANALTLAAHAGATLACCLPSAARTIVATLTAADAGAAVLLEPADTAGACVAERAVVTVHEGACVAGAGLVVVALADLRAVAPRAMLALTIAASAVRLDAAAAAPVATPALGVAGPPRDAVCSVCQAAPATCLVPTCQCRALCAACCAPGVAARLHYQCPQCRAPMTHVTPPPPPPRVHSVDEFFRRNRARIAAPS